MVEVLEFVRTENHLDCQQGIILLTNLHHWYTFSVKKYDNIYLALERVDEEVIDCGQQRKQEVERAEGIADGIEPGRSGGDVAGVRGATT